MDEIKNKLRIAAIGDIHVTETSQGKYQKLLKDIESAADVLVLCGDLTDHGNPIEAKILRDELKNCIIPKLAVLGNHDHEFGKAEEVKKILQDGGIIMLDDETFQVNNVGFAGVKGFGGGFGQQMLTAFGEKAIKDFVDAGMLEVKQLEIGLAKLQDTKHKVVALHYSPIRATNEGENLEIYPYLGSSRLEEVIDRFLVSYVFHGHAHHGSHYGKTTKGAEVFNVSMPLMNKINDAKPFKVIEIVS